jgi:hypothetical protein
MNAFTHVRKSVLVKFASVTLVATALLFGSLTVSAGAATTLSVVPTSATVTPANSSSFATTLAPTGFSGSPTITYSETSANPALLFNTATGVIRSSGTLTVGKYSISGGVSDASGDAGTWAFTLNVALPATLTNPTVARTISTGSLDEQLYTFGSILWVANLTAGTVTEILESTGAILHVVNFTTTSSGFAPSGIASDGVNVWVTNFNGSDIEEFNVAQLNANSSTTVPSSSLTLVTTNTNTTVPPVGNSEPSDISLHGGYVWVTTQSGGALLQINAATGAVVQTISSAGDLMNPRGVSSDGTDVWVANPGYAFGGNNNDCAATGTTQWNNTVSEFNATTGAFVRSINVGNAYSAGVISGSQPFDVSTDGTYTWVTLKCQDAVAKINSATGLVVGYVALPSGSLPEGVSSDGTNVWVSESGLNQVQEIDAATATIIGTFALPAGSNPWGITYDGTHVWVADFTNGAVSEIVSTPILTPTALPSGTVGTPYVQTLTASGGAAGTYSITCTGTPPAGITVTPTSTGVTISGTPTTGGFYANAVNCTVSDSTGVSSTDVIPLVVLPLSAGAAGPPTVVATPASGVTTTGATLNGTVNPNNSAVTSQAFCYIAGLTLVDCAGATIVPVTPATLPATATPTTLSATVAGLFGASPYCYQLSATNSFGTTYSAPVCFATAGSGPIITTTSLANDQEFLPYSAPVNTVGGTMPIHFSATGLPKGLAINPVTGQITGIALQLGTYPVTITATDATGLFNVKTLSLTVVTPSLVVPGQTRYITHFNENKSTLTSQDLLTCQQIALYIAIHPVKLESMVGYTDPLDTHVYNLALGERRSVSVEMQIRKDLTAMHVPQSKASTASLGATHFVEAGLSNSARALDRRVTIVLS